MGPEFFQTYMGRKFYESDVPSIAKSLKAIAEGLAKQQQLMEGFLKQDAEAKAFTATSTLYQQDPRPNTSYYGGYKDGYKGALQDALATLTRWREHAPDSWDERDELTLANISNALKEEITSEMQNDLDAAWNELEELDTLLSKEDFTAKELIEQRDMVHMRIKDALRAMDKHTSCIRKEDKDL